MSRHLNRRTVLAVLLIIILGTFLPPLINVSRFRSSVADSLSRALGRTVSIAAVHPRLFPRPGLDLERLVVQDDPAFSAEPLLHSDQVTASLRIASLWRGRLEIARLTLSYPSLNLVRAPDGHWNLESLLERARQIPTAPTPERNPGPRPRFPYVEAQHGRINLKIGQEKTVYALSDADFALSLPSENIWQLRLSARPIRTDANLGDTGAIRISGSVQRGATLTDTPLDLHIALDGAQLGQLTTLVYGRDRGWRGTVKLDADLRGTPAALNIAGNASVDDFRRYDIATRGSLRLATRCTGAFSTTTQQWSNIACQSPVEGGTVIVTGTVDGVLPVRDYALSVQAKDLPAASVLALSRRMKKDLPEDLQAAGTLSGVFDLQSDTWEGAVTTQGLRFDSKLIKSPLALGHINFHLGTTSPASAKGTVPPPGVTALRMDDLALDLGGPSTAKAQAWFARDQYNISINGEARINRLLELAHAFAVPVPHATLTGLANADLHVSGSWTGFAAPVVTGNLHLRSVTAAIPGIAAPLQVATAALHLAPDAAAIYNAAVAFTGTHLSFTGSLQIPRVCPSAPCPIAFQLRADQLSTDEINALLNPRAQKRPWYAFIGGNPAQPALLSNVSAVGKLSAARVDLKSLTARRFSGDVRLDSGILTIRNLNAEVLGGTTTAELRADFTGPQPAYALNGTLQQASMASIAAITRDAWATGKTNATYRATVSGWDAAQLRASASGAVSFDWRDGTLSHLELSGLPAPLRLRRFQGELTLANGSLVFKPSKMETPAGIYVVSGTASFDRQLGLRLVRGETDGFEITGTVDKPRVTPLVLPTTQTAAMKP